MTEREHEKLCKVGDSFWNKFSILCATHIAMMPERLQAETTSYLGDLTSIYGSAYDKHLPSLRRK